MIHRTARVLGFIGMTATANLHAQTIDSSAARPDSDMNSASVTAARLAGPRLDLTATAVRRLAPADSAELQYRPQPQSLGKPVALMVVGGAAFVLGAVISEDVGTLFMVGGASAFLVGLYQYLR